MTPIQDHGFARRQRIIKDPRSAAKLHYQALIAKGLREDDAANMAGWHPLDEFDTWFGRATVAITIAVVMFLLIILTNNANAMMDMRGDLKSSSSNEAALVDCMNGEVVRFSDGSRWACVKLMGARK